MAEITKRTWRNSPWTVVVGLPVVIVFASALFLQVISPHHGSLERACRANLLLLQQAKQSWAKSENKSGNDIATDAKFFGQTNYMLVKPECPSGGTYAIGSVVEKPRCSIPGHTI
jgi:hypothetical protein